MSTITDMPDLSALTNVEGLREQMIEQVDEAIAKLEEPRRQVNALYEQYTDLRSRLTGSTRGRRSDGPRPRQGVNRQQEFVAVVREHPGITISDAAKQMNVAANYLYRIRDKAKARGEIRVDGSNVFPSENGSDASAAPVAAGRGKRS